MKGYKPPPKKSRRPNKPTPAPPLKRESIIVTTKNIDKLSIYFTDHEIAQILYFVKES